ncbi:MAG: sulfate ABC transporter substrate-binding protein [Planctomycetaceae bacterium]|nr:sulfate ABC transporter substrate-binding protein [Planctomycetaceae bacterium]
MKKSLIALLCIIIALTAGCPAPNHRLINVSYDPTRELYREFNQAFIEHYYNETGKTIRIEVTHGGSSAQARNVINGLEADVVTLALAYDIDSIAQHTGLLPPDWQARLPHNSTPYSSTVVFLVRDGNPKNIKSWECLIRPDVEVVVADPRTSGVARWAYLAGWGYILKRELAEHGNLYKRLHDPDAAAELAAAQADIDAAQETAREYISAIYQNVRILPQGARSASQVFVRQNTGDVLLDWENQAKLTINEFGKGQIEIVVPPISILAEPPVALIDGNVDKRGTREVAQAYLEFLYSPIGQDMVARHYYRPRDAEILAKYRDNFVEVEMFTVDEVFGGWHKAQQEHFETGGVFERIYIPVR